MNSNAEVLHELFGAVGSARELQFAITRLKVLLNLDGLGALLHPLSGTEVLLVAEGVTPALVEATASSLVPVTKACVVARPQDVSCELADLLRAEGVTACLSALASRPGDVDGRLVGFVRQERVTRELMWQFETAARWIAETHRRLRLGDARPAEEWANEALAACDTAAVLVDALGVVRGTNAEARALVPWLGAGGRLSRSLPAVDLSFDAHAHDTRQRVNLPSGLVEVTIQPLRDTGAAIVRLQPAALADERRQQATEAGRLQTLGALTATLAHDLNNMLLPLVLASDSLSHATSPAELEEETSFIVDSASRAATMVRELLDFDRGTVSTIGPVDVNANVLRALRLVRRLLPDSIVLSSQLSNVSRAVVGESDLVRAVVNLCVNGRQAMPRGGTLTVSVREETLGEARAGAWSTLEAGTWVVVEVRDTGVGIEAARLPKLFRRFETTRAESGGSGLGLSMVRDALDRASGGAEVTSKAGAGTSVRLFLRIAAPH